MQQMVREIPPAPRRVRWRAVQWYRWPVLLVGLLLCLYGGAFTWMLFLAAGTIQHDGKRLAAGPVERLPGTVLQVQADRGWFDHRKADLVEYRFEVDGMSLPGTCFAPADAFTPGQAVTVACLKDRTVHCIEGMELHLLGAWFDPWPWFALIVLPGIFLVTGWALAAWQMRHMMRHGDVAVATIERITVVPWMLPPMLRVDYRYRDHRAAERHKRQWVVRRSALGQRLLAEARRGSVRLPVVHDRRFAQLARIALPEDFLRSGAPPLPPVMIEH